MQLRIANLAHHRFANSSADQQLRVSAALKATCRTLAGVAITGTF